MIVVTGAAGFIGSNVLADLEAAGMGPLVACDWLGNGDKWRNVAKRSLDEFVAPEDVMGFLEVHAGEIGAVIHMGAISATTERDVDRLVRLNINATLALWDWCSANGVHFIYASSAASYGALEQGLIDDESPAAIAALKPLNAYGWSKKATDQIVVARVSAGRRPPAWAGLRFFNVYGPNEDHKDDMKSVIAKFFQPIRDGKTVRLFKSDRAGIAHGQQMRDFIYVKDCTRTILWLLRHPEVSGIFNVGTGVARSFADLAKGVGGALGVPVDIEYIDMPEALKNKYQYFTKAEMAKLRGRGLDFAFHGLEEGIADYVQSYLDQPDAYR